MLRLLQRLENRREDKLDRVLGIRLVFKVQRQLFLLKMLALNAPILRPTPMSAIKVTQ